MIFDSLSAGRVANFSAISAGASFRCRRLEKPPVFRGIRAFLACRSKSVLTLSCDSGTKAGSQCRPVAQWKLLWTRGRSGLSPGRHKTAENASTRGTIDVLQTTYGEEKFTRNCPRHLRNVGPNTGKCTFYEITGGRQVNPAFIRDSCTSQLINRKSVGVGVT